MGKADLAKEPYGCSATPADILRDVAHRVEARLGKIAIAGRIHHYPKRRLEDDYEVERRTLGVGSSGAVLSAWSLHTNGGLAVKRLKVRGCSLENVHAMVDELEVAVCADHPHVVRLVDIYSSQDYIYLVMQRQRGGSLSDRIFKEGKFKRIPEQSAVDFTRQMLMAVNHLHRMGFAHRDVRPQNFLLDDRDSNFLRLINFGYSRLASKKNGGTSQRFGPLAYIAPEMIAGHGGGRSSDLWSIGVITFVMLFGHLPFGEDSRAVLNGKARTPEAQWRQVSRQAACFLRKLLVVDAGRRPTAEQALADPWLLGTVGSSEVGRSAGLDRHVASAFVHFSRATKLRQGCWRLMARSAAAEERSACERVFLDIVGDRSGVLKPSDLPRLLNSRSGREADRKVKSTMGTFTSLYSGEFIAYSDFVAAMLSLNDHRGVLELTLQRFDSHSGDMTAKSLCNKLGLKVPVESANSQVPIAVADLVLYLSCPELGAGRDTRLTMASELSRLQSMTASRMAESSCWQASRLTEGLGHMLVRLCSLA
mmetsp:Transcript_46710/g.117610  ORF Transcript_46710/g.117610 Transcript_46710/m.117610 type:complete len:536 (+) Transcript_46710:42-1649(+)